MKKTILFFLLSSNLVFATENSLNFSNLLTKIENDRESYEYKNFKNTQDNINVRIKDDKLGDYNGVTITSTYNVSENVFEDKIKKYDKSIQNRMTYGNFFVNHNFIEKDNSYVSYGVEKNLKDLFYSKYDSDLKINKLNLNLNDLSYKKNIQNKKIELVNLYQDILNAKDELEYRKSSYEHYRLEFEKLKKSYELGASPKINVESIELEVEEAEIRINILEEKIKSLYEIAKNQYNVDFNQYSLGEFESLQENFEDLLKNYMQTDIEELENSLKVAKEKEKYSNYDRFMPDLYLGYERVDKKLRGDRYYRNQDTGFIKFSKKLFSTDSEYKTNKLEVEKIENELKEKTKKIKDEKLKLKAEYVELKKLASISDKKLENLYKKYKIKEKEYELNRASYLDVIDEYNKYLSQGIATKKVKNDLNAFMYKVKIRN